LAEGTTECVPIIGGCAAWGGDAEGTAFEMRDAEFDKLAWVRWDSRFVSMAVVQIKPRSHKGTKKVI
jgi:hypothetical protein